MGTKKKKKKRKKIERERRHSACTIDDMHYFAILIGTVMSCYNRDRETSI